MASEWRSFAKSANFSAWSECVRNAECIRKTENGKRIAECGIFCDSTESLNSRKSEFTKFRFPLPTEESPEI